MLGRKLSVSQWLGILCCAVGVACLHPIGLVLKLWQPLKNL